MTKLTAETRTALRAAVDSGVQTMCLNCLRGVREVPTSTFTGGTSKAWTHGPGGWEGLRCPRRLTVARPFEFVALLDALDAVEEAVDIAEGLLMDAPNYDAETRLVSAAALLRIVQKLNAAIVGQEVVDDASDG